MLSAYCMCCLVKRQLRMLNKFDDEEKKALYMSDVLEILRNMEKGEAAPVAVSKMDALFARRFGATHSFEEEKEKYNRLLLEKEEELMALVNESPDRLLCALKLARVGNYIDFGALNTVEDEKLEALIQSAPREELDTAEYERFKEELSSAKQMVYLPDNCGEIVFDKILIRVITEEFPSLDLRIIVRGAPVLNDATVKDAVFVGIDRYAPVIGNGNGIAGTYLPSVSPEARALIDSADLILAKGQGNFETLFGCGKNVYYAFLCKCEWFVRRFGMTRLEGVFTNERRQKFNVSGATL